ncbi:hypothetical protein GGI07_002131 [Coemansia sp. Benny D115]|nr:hypothetical protein GGI07_002131 [Coemansia sp. Benny D115]
MDSRSSKMAAQSCRRHRRNSDAFIDCKQTKRTEDSSEGGEYSSGDEDSTGTASSMASRASCLDQHVAAHRRHQHGMASDSEELCQPSRRTLDHMGVGRGTIGNGDSPLSSRKRPMQQQSHLLCRKSSLYSGGRNHVALSQKDVSRALQEALQGNTQEEPMSSARALRIFNTVFPAVVREQSARLEERHPTCKQCLSEAVEAGGSDESTESTELRVNLGDGRNAVYVAPCERHPECPLEKKGKYLIHTNKSKIMTDLSKVEFGICVDGWRRVVFKTVNDSALALRELDVHQRVAQARPTHLVPLLDAFEDNSGKHVMVFPRMTTAQLFGLVLSAVASMARQVFAALSGLHVLGIAHMDVTPTNVMADPNDASHVELIDLGLAHDLSLCAELPSRGTCGFVAPEVLHGGARDLRADMYSAGVVLGMMLQRFLPTVALRLLGGPLVRSDTTDMLVQQLDELLDSYGYAPAPAAFVACNAPAELRTRVCGDRVARKRSSRSYSDDDEAAAFAAAYVGASIYGGYGDDSDADADAPASVSGSFDTHATSPPVLHHHGHSQADARYVNGAAHCIRRPGRVPAAVLHAADLLRWTLQHDPQRRPTADQALAHPFLASASLAAANGAGQRRRPRQSEPLVSAGVGSGATGTSQRSGSTQPGPVSTFASATASPVALSEDPEFFAHTSLADVASWEDEMHQRLAPATPCDARRSWDTGSSTFYSFGPSAACSSSMDDDDAGCLASYYGSSGGYNDLTSYFY